MKSIKIGILGFGTVANGVAHLIAKNKEEITRRLGCPIIIEAVYVRTLERDNPHELKLTTNVADILENPNIDVVVELMGGIEPAFEYINRALAQNKHVVTANKALIALQGNTLFNTAAKKGLIIAFEAAVAGGIPIIKTLREGLVGNEIEWLAGIINGTGNYILTEMSEQSRPFAEVLKEAQTLGYAEADPSFDVEGIDAAHKLTILASIAFGIPLQFDQVFTEGISHITPIDIQYANQLGYTIKHLGIAKQVAQGIEMRVHPTLIPKKRLIANVHGVMNAVLIKGNAVGPILSYGAGAGANPTASSVLADLADVARMLTTPSKHRVPYLAFQDSSLSNKPILPQADIETAYYLRIQAVDRPGVLSDITHILSQNDISIEQMIQAKSQQGDIAEIIMTTHRTKERFIQDALRQIEASAYVKQSVMLIRIESFYGS